MPLIGQRALTHSDARSGFNDGTDGYGDAMTSGRPDRNQELEKIVDDLDENVIGEREADDVPGKPSTREQEPKKGSTDEPTA